MARFSKTFYTYQDLIFKALLVLISTTLIVYFLPKEGKFQYEINKGLPWQNENVYADEDFAILKSEENINREKEQIRTNAILYFTYDADAVETVFANYESNFAAVFNDSLSRNRQIALKRFGKEILEELYNPGILNETLEFEDSRIAYLQKGNRATQIPFDQLITSAEVAGFLEDKLANSQYRGYQKRFLQLYFDIITPNVTYDRKLTEKAIEEELQSVSSTRGIVNQGSLIVARGEMIEGETLQKLLSLKAKYETQKLSDSKYNWILLGYIILVLLALIMLFLFIKTYRRTIYENNIKVTFVLFNVVFMVLVTVAVVHYFPMYVYAVPLCILPLVIKAFFDARLGLFTHVITVLLLGFIVPDSFEYFFLQIIAGIVTILTVPELYKRANLFISVGQITLIYIVAFFAFHSIHEGGVEGLAWENFAIFLVTGLLMLFVQPLIYIYEKIFGLVSDVSLLELSDTNTKLLKNLADIAPGTFHHSLNVANLSEAAANEIGANAMLVRVGALYHDIGKMTNPTNFTENQASGVNTHEDFSPLESTSIIINHVIDGVELARKNNLPDRVIDFIRTHHGTSTVHYFYRKAKEMNEEVNIDDFRYPGPLPFSKETAILMMADSVEAASKSLKSPTYPLIDSFVEKIINKQMAEGQFLNANITFKEIESIKKVLKKKLTNIYHLRVEYPE